MRGGGLTDARSDRAFNISESDDIDLEHIPSGRIENLLRDAAGLQQFRRSDARSANPTSQGITLRGLGGNAASRALLLVDGVPQSDPFGGWISWASYDGLPLRVVKIRRGGGSGAEGPGALAGTVELYTLNRAADAGERFSADVLVNNDQDVSVRGQVALASEAADVSQAPGILLGMAYDRGDGFIPIVASRRGVVDSRAGYEQASLSAKINANMDEGNELQFGARGFLDRRNRGLPFSDNETYGIDSHVRLTGEGGAWAYSLLGYVQLREFSSQFGAVNAARTAVSPTLDQFSVPALGLGSRAEVRRTDDYSEVRIGVDWRQVSGRTNEYFNYSSGLAQRLRRAGGNSATFGAYLEYSGSISDNLLLTGGARLDHYAIGQGNLFESQLANGAVLTDIHFGPRNGLQWTGRAGASYDGIILGQNRLKLKASLYRGWRLPTLNELYRPFRVGADAVAANAALQPETLDGAEIGLAWGEKGKRLSHRRYAAIAVFYNRLNDAIANVTAGQGPGVFSGVGFVAAGGTYRQRQNLPELRAAGLEAEVEWPIGRTYFGATYSYSGAKFRGGALGGLRPAQVPKHSAIAKLGWNYNAYSGASVQLRYTSGQFEDDQNSLRLKPALTIDAEGLLRVSNTIQLVARAENLFDAEVQAAISSAGIVERSGPRTLWLGVRFVIP